MTYSLTLLRIADIKQLSPSESNPSKKFTGHCLQCGRCCKFFNCPAFDFTTNKCKVHYNRPIACRQWPTNLDEFNYVKCKGFKLRKRG